jgi:Fic family protein
MARGPDGYRRRGSELRIIWKERPAAAWIPQVLSGQDFQLGVRAARLTERAAAAVVAAGSRLPRIAPLAMLLLRAEGVASSYIEGIRTPLADVAASEVGGSDNPIARLISDNLAAALDALGTSGSTLTMNNLHEWHRRLLGEDDRLSAEMVGAFRNAQSWIGGTSPRDAAYVPPPPDRVPDLMEDLLSFVNDESLDPVTQAAVAHAQFETIHPYGDGNGRIGRILIGWILAHRLGVEVPPPVSVAIARDPGGYLAGMTLFRMGQLDPWVEWMAVKLQQTGESEVLLESRVRELFDSWRSRLAPQRADATSRKVLDLLGEHPVISSDVIAAQLKVSERAARSALRTMAEHKIVDPYEQQALRRGRPRRFWVATELIELIGQWA